jgi:phosphoribosylglycinamide formyltransferase-1
MKPRLAIIGSTAGSAFAATADCLRAAGKNTDWTVIVDRTCGLEQVAEGISARCIRLSGLSREAFSTDALAIARDHGCTAALLFFTRLIAEPLVSGLDVWNIHPSILPAYPGLDGLGDARASGAPLLGATLHRVDLGVDTGAIIAQLVDVFPGDLSGPKPERISFMQKVWLALIWYEIVTENKSIQTDRFISERIGLSTHRLNVPLLSAFNSCFDSITNNPS